MAVPKRKTSKGRKGIRRSHHRLQAPSLSKCSRCGSSTKPHAVCPSCGYYRGISVLPQLDDTNVA